MLITAPHRIRTLIRNIVWRSRPFWVWRVRLGRDCSPWLDSGEPTGFQLDNDFVGDVAVYIGASVADAGGAVFSGHRDCLRAGSLSPSPQPVTAIRQHSPSRGVAGVSPHKGSAETGARLQGTTFLFRSFYRSYLQAFSFIRHRFTRLWHRATHEDARRARPEASSYPCPSAEAGRSRLHVPASIGPLAG